MPHYSVLLANVSVEKYGLIVNISRKTEIQVDYAPASKVGKAVSSSLNSLWPFKPTVLFKARSLGFLCPTFSPSTPSRGSLARDLQVCLLKLQA